MQVKAEGKYIRISPYKLRPIADVIRGKSLAESQAYLKAHMTKRVKPILKVLDSAYANAKNLHKEVDSPEMLMIKKIAVDQGPVLKYYKPAAMGRAAVQRRRLSHVTVVLEKKR
ncbi:50S ribosomal protein L22 [Candidatus Dependentiae bacterium]|nr:50S ribosomal protein L22 [Candidatus Dependentiae bacterium]